MSQPRKTAKKPVPRSGARKSPPRKPNHQGKRPAQGRGSAAQAAKKAHKPVKQKKQKKAAQPQLLSDQRREELYELASGRGFKAVNARAALRRDEHARNRIEEEKLGEAWRPKRPLSARGRDGDGGGEDFAVGSTIEARATTDVLAGFYPWALGAGSPVVGTPVGQHLLTGASVHFDATNWMVRGGFITAPIVLVLALNGFGKSSLIRRMQTGAVAQKRTSLVLGDAKPDFRDQTEAFGGQIVQLGHGLGHLNPLDVGALGRVVPQLEAAATALEAVIDADEADEVAQAAVRTHLHGVAATRWWQCDGQMREEKIEELRAKAREVRLDVQMRQQMMIGSLVQLVRKNQVNDFEETMIASAIKLLYNLEQFDENNPPLLQDLYDILQSNHPVLMEDAGVDVPPEGTWDDLEESVRADLMAQQARAVADYKHEVRGLRRSLRALLQGEFGEIFNNHTTTRLNLDAPAICVDVSKIPHSEASSLRAAVLLTCWSDGFGTVEAAHVLADAGMGPKRTFQVIMDELWQVLNASPAMVSKVNQLSRLNRGLGTELIMITHSIVDFDAFDSAQTRNEATGLVERARVKILGALPAKEVARLRSVVEISDEEEYMITSWSAPQSLTGNGVRPGEKPPPAPGTGNFLIKVGERGPGIPFHLSFVAAEVDSGVHNTNKRYDAVDAMNKPGQGDLT